MKIGMVTDSLGHLGFDDMLAASAELGLECIELCTGNWSAAPHLDLPALLGSARAREDFLARIRDHGLSISALNANGNPLHPQSGVQQDRCLRQTLELAGLLGVERVNTMSGLPGGPGDANPNWIVAAWPPECQSILDYQWNELAIPYWRDLVRFASAQGVERVCLELHAGQLVYNTASFLRLREAAGEMLAVNLDPSHLIWMGADPLACIRELGSAIGHVHAKDALIDPRNTALNSRLDPTHSSQVLQRSWSYVTLGYGQSENWWNRFCYQLRTVGYDDVLSIEHEDSTLSRREGLEKSVALLQRCRAGEPSDYELPDI